MEVEGCQRLLQYLQSVGLKIRVFATDRSTTIRAMMAKMFPEIKHQFDIWYVLKRGGVSKKNRKINDNIPFSLPPPHTHILRVGIF